MRLKRIVFCLIFLLCKSISIYSQPYEDTAVKTVRTSYLTLSIAGPALFFHPQTDGILNVSFPYISKDLSGNVKNQRFNSSSVNLFNENTFKLGFINGEYGNSKNYISLNFILIIKKDIACDFVLGYGLNIDFDDHFKLINKKNKTEKTFRFKPSLGFGYSDYISKNIGSIDGKD